jgi:hypothetical protein
VFLLHEIDWVSVDRDICGLAELYQRGVAGTSPSHGLQIKEARLPSRNAQALYEIHFLSHHEPKDRLKIIISQANSDVHEGRLEVDGMYDKVLLHRFKGVDRDETEFFVDLWFMVGSIAVVLDLLSYPCGWNMKENIHELRRYSLNADIEDLDGAHREK